MTRRKKTKKTTTMSMTDDVDYETPMMKDI